MEVEIEVSGIIFSVTLSESIQDAEGFSWFSLHKDAHGKTTMSTYDDKFFNNVNLRKVFTESLKDHLSNSNTYDGLITGFRLKGLEEAKQAIIKLLEES